MTALEMPERLDDLNAFAALGGKLTGDELLTQVHALPKTYVVFPSPEAADAVTLFVAATHAAAELEFAARLVIKSPVKRCGKSRLEDVLSGLVRQPLLTASISAASLVHAIEPRGPHDHHAR